MHSSVMIPKHLSMLDHLPLRTMGLECKCMVYDHYPLDGNREEEIWLLCLTQRQDVCVIKVSSLC